MDFALERKKMVEHQLAARGIADARVLDAMRRVPRELFVEPSRAPLAYSDTPLPIGHGQTISQPYVVALMLQIAAIRPGDGALEIGAGSGYAAAVLAGLAASVVTIERHAPLAALAAQRLSRAGCANVEVVCADGTLGYEPRAPYDVILVAAAGRTVPDGVKRQLAVGGRMVMPVGEDIQRLVCFTRISGDEFLEVAHASVSFVPLVGG